MTKRKTYEVVYSPHYTPQGEALDPRAYLIHAHYVVKIRAIYADAAVVKVEHVTKRMAMSCRQLPIAFKEIK